MAWQWYDTADTPHEWHPPASDDVARALAERHAGTLRYCHDAQAWIVWDGALWRRDRTGHVLHLVRTVARELGTDPGALASQTTGGHATGAHAAGGRATGARAFIAAAELFARSEPDLAVTAAGDADPWDADPMLLGTPGGAVDLRSGATVPADPAHGLTRAVAVAPAESADCPLWLKFLGDAFKDDGALIGFVQKFCGYALTGSMREQVVVVGLGKGRNGKSVFLNTILGLMGGYARPATLGALLSTDRSRNGAALAACHAARLVGVAESDETWTLRQLKVVTGGDLLPDHTAWSHTAGRPSCKLLVMGNAPPTLSRFDTAIGRRLCVLPFRHMPAQPDRDLEIKLRAEWPAILRWAIDGCRRWQAEDLGRPAAVVEATIAVMEEQDPIGQFLTERCVGCPTDTTRSEAAAALFAAWRYWAEAAGEPAGTQRAFAAALTDRGFARERTEHARLYRGLSLRKIGG